jgi:hypothetical protein
MWTLFSAVAFAAGYAASIYSWSRIKLWVNGAQTEIANLEAKAAALRRRCDMWVKVKACCLHSLTMAWSYCPPASPARRCRGAISSPMRRAIQI